MNTKSRSTLHKVPVYEVRLVQARRPLRLAESFLTDSSASAHALHALIGMTDREHFAALFINGRHQITGAHIAAIGGQHGIGGIDPRVILRAALAACCCGFIVGHYAPRSIMPVLLPSPLWGGQAQLPAIQLTRVSRTAT